MDTIETQFPDVKQMIRGQKIRGMVVMSLFLATVLLIYGVMGKLLYQSPTITGFTAWLVGVSILVSLVLPVLVCFEPRYGIYILFAGCFLFGGDPSQPHPTIPTTLVPFWWNITIIFQRYANFTPHGLIVSPAEVILALSFVVWFIHETGRREFKFVPGPFAGWMLIFGVVLITSMIFGFVRGGDFNAALWEVRAQAHFILAYFLAVNLIRKREHIWPILWMLVFCVGLNGIFGAFTFASMGGAVDENGIMPHDDSLLFNLVFFMFFLSAITGFCKKMTWWSLVMCAGCVVSVMANQRRAGIGAFIVAFVPLLPILWIMWPERRKQIKAFTICFGAFSAVYLPITWNMNGPFALPARAIRSNSSPSSRDAQSNDYRTMENDNLKYTRDLNPWTGIGFGRPFARIIVMPDISFGQKDYFAHNSILWLWANIGHVGFFIFLMMIAKVLIEGIHLLKKVRDPLLRIPGLLAIVQLLMLFIFAKFDLQLVNSRQMVLTAMLLGILANLPAMEKNNPEEVVLDAQAEPEPAQKPAVATGIPF